VEPFVAATVASDGELNFAGSGVNASNARGVRPALWVTKE
jgi:hypothetical protein